MDALPPPEVLAERALHLLAAKYFMLAGFVMTLYDIIITTDMEIERIWKQKFTWVTVLYFMNRYIAVLSYILIITAFQLPALSDPDMCERVVRFAGASTQISVATIGMILILRTYALFGRNKYILVILSALWVAEMIVMAWTFFPHTIRLPLPPGFVGCILAPEPGYELRASFFWILPCGFDAIVFALTLYRTIVLHRRQVRLPLLTMIIRDGSAYFFAIAAVNVINVLLFLLAPPDIQPINASFTQLLGTTVVSRLMLNLKNPSLQNPSVGAPPPQHHSDVEAHPWQRGGASFINSAVDVFRPKKSDIDNSTSTFEMQPPPVSFASSDGMRRQMQQQPGEQPSRDHLAPHSGQNSFMPDLGGPRNQTSAYSDYRAEW